MIRFMDRRQFLSSTLLAPAMAGRARLRTAICAYSFRKELQAKTMTYEDLVRSAVDWDVDGLDLTVYWFPSTSNDFLLPLRRLAYKLGVEIYSISVRTELTRSSAEDRTKEVSSICNWVDVADKLGAGHIRVFGGTVPKGFTEDQAAPWVAECLLRASDYAARKGIILGLENHGGITARAERIISIVRQVNSPWVGINLDTGNFNTDVFPQIEMCLPYAVNVQVKTEMTGEGGKREPQDWDKVVSLLAQSGYKGYLALEYEAGESAPQAVPRLMAKLRQVASRHSS